MEIPIFIYATILDVITTITALSDPGVIEANPIYGPQPTVMRLVLIRLGFVGVILFMSFCIRIRLQWRYRVLIGLSCLYVAASFNNLLVTLGII